MMCTGSLSWCDMKSHGGEDTTEKPLHIADATAVELAVSRGECKGIASPGLAFNRDAIAMAGKPDPAFTGRPDGRKQTRLSPVLRGDQRRGNAVALERGPYVLDELQIRFRARRVEGDEGFQQPMHCRLRSRHADTSLLQSSAFATRPGLGRCRAEAISRSGAGFHCLDLAVAWRSVGDERIDQLACRARDLVDRPVECNLVGL